MWQDAGHQCHENKEIALIALIIAPRIDEPVTHVQTIESHNIISTVTMPRISNCILGEKAEINGVSHIKKEDSVINP